MACEASATEGAALPGILEMVCSYFPADVFLRQHIQAAEVAG